MLFRSGKRQVVDGRQRLTTVFEFMNNEFALKNLKILHEQNGKNFNDLEPILQGTIERHQFLIYVIQPPTPENIKFDIFDRVNRSGTILNHQEMRNALYQGKATDLLNKLVQLDCFKQATGNGISSKRMKDKYLVLRFLSFYMLYKNWLGDIEYKSDIDDFLAKTMKFINKLDNEKITKLEKIFITAMRNSYKILDKNGFRFAEETGKPIRPINMALFEVVAYFCNEIEVNNIGDRIKKELESLKQEFDAGKTFLSNMDGSVNVTYRFNKINELRDSLCDK